MTMLSAEKISDWSQRAGEPAWLTEQRASAFAAYQSAPLPPKTEEAWKYSNIEAWWDWSALSWSPVAQITRSSGALPDGVVYAALADAVRTHASLVAPYVQIASATAAQQQRTFSGGQGRPYSGGRYLQQQEALWNDGTFLHVPAGTRVDAPLQLTVQTGAGACFPRTIIVLGEQASATVVETLTGPAASAASACHARVEVYLAPGARLQYIHAQTLPDNAACLLHQHAMVGRDAHFAATNITLGGRATKSIIESALTAPGAESLLFGLAFGDTTRHIDQHTLQTHLAPNTHSDLLYKTALTDTARATYTGLIHMHPAAQQAAAYQANRNLLLSKGAQANTIPQLEIEADDVKCSHGATVGPIDLEQCYYLTSRGLSHAAAQQMIVAGFFEDLLVRLPDVQLADAIRTTLADKLARIPVV